MCNHSVILNNIYQDRHKKVCKQNYQETFQILPKTNLKWIIWLCFLELPSHEVRCTGGCKKLCAMKERFKLYSYWECLQKLLQLFSHPFLHPNRDFFFCFLQPVLYSFHIGIFEGIKQIHLFLYLCMLLWPDNMNWAAFINLNAWVLYQVFLAPSLQSPGLVFSKHSVTNDGCTPTDAVWN